MRQRARMNARERILLVLLSVSVLASAGRFAYASLSGGAGGDDGGERRLLEYAELAQLEANSAHDLQALATAQHSFEALDSMVIRADSPSQLVVRMSRIVTDIGEETGVDLRSIVVTIDSSGKRRVAKIVAGIQGESTAIADFFDALNSTAPFASVRKVHLSRAFSDQVKAPTWNVSAELEALVKRNEK